MAIEHEIDLKSRHDMGSCIVSWNPWYSLSIVLEARPTDHWDGRIDIWHSLYNPCL